MKFAINQNMGNLMLWSLITLLFMSPTALGKFSFKRFSSEHPKTTRTLLVAGTAALGYGLYRLCKPGEELKKTIPNKPSNQPKNKPRVAISDLDTGIVFLHPSTATGKEFCDNLQDLSIKKVPKKVYEDLTGNNVEVSVCGLTGKDALKLKKHAFMRNKYTLNGKDNELQQKKDLLNVNSK